MYKDVHEYVKSCDTCQHSKRQYGSHPAPLQPMSIEGKFERWHMDILGPLTKAQDGSKYILLLVDSFTRWPEAFPLKSQEATEIATILYREIFTRYGAPHTLISDRGTNFMSKLISAMSDMFNITRHHTS